MQIKVVIADDHTLFRQGLRSLLRVEETIQIVGEAVNGIDTISVVTDLNPDIVLLDIKMPELNGIDVIPHIREKSPGTKSLMLTASKDEDNILRALKAGAKGYLSKDANISDLIKAIHAVHLGEVWVERKLISRLLNDDASAEFSGKGRDRTQGFGLTLREKDVLCCLTAGGTNKQIADKLCISERTVKSHLHHIFKKLNVNRRLEAILYALNHGLT